MHLIAGSDVVYLFAALPIGNIVEAWVVSFLDAVAFRQNALANDVEI